MRGIKKEKLNKMVKFVDSERKQNGIGRKIIEEKREIRQREQHGWKENEEKREKESR